MRRFLCILLLMSALPLAAQRRATVSGHLTDAMTGETLLGAGVLVEDASLRQPVGALTNEFGYYSLTLPAGEVRLQYSYVGYESVTLTLDLQRDTLVSLALTPSSLQEAVIVARKDAGLQSSFLGSIEVPIAQVRSTPVVFGEADVLKAIQLLPGVQGGSEGSTGLYVRGGGPDENLILLDGIPIYNVDHMLGILSVFQTEAVKKVTLYKGSFPARYAGRTSSVVDIRTNDGNMKETHGSVGLGVLTDKFHLEGPIVKEKLSYSVSARGLHTLLYDPIIRFALRNQDTYGNYYFYDLNAKLTWRLSDRDRFIFGGYSGRDRMNVEFEEDMSQETDMSRAKMGLGWGNDVASVRWNHVFSSRLFSNTTLSFNRYKMLWHMEMRSVDEEGTRLRYDVDYNSGIRDWGARMDFDWTPSPRHLVKFGVQYMYHTFVPETLTAIREVSGPEADPGMGLDFRSPYKNYHGHDFSVYGEDDFPLTDHLTLNPGLHAAFFYTDGKPYFNLQPRISAKYALDMGLSFKTGYARMAQYVHLLSSFSLSLPLDLWVPITKDIRPVTSDQVSAGVYYDGLKGWEFSVEGYFKYMNNLLEYKDGTILIGSSSGWENKVEMGSGRAYGLELMAQRTQGKVTGWLAYTLAKSDRIFPDGTINLGRRFPYKYDRRHNFNASLTWAITPSIDMNLAWQIASGSLTTVPLQRTVVVDPAGQVHEADYVSERNNYRLPASHHLDIGFSFRTRRGWTWNLSVYNVYNRMNPNLAFVTYETRWNQDRGETYQQAVLEKITLLPIMPSLAITYEF